MAAAVCVHFAIFSLVSRLPRVRNIVLEAPPPELEIEVAPASEEVKSTTSLGAAIQGTPRHEAAHSRVGESGGAQDALTNDPINAPPVSSSGESPSIPFGGMITMNGNRNALGLSGPNSFAQQAAIEGIPDTSVAARSAALKQQLDHSLRAPLLERDRAMGLLQEAPAIHALEDITRASIAPLEGRAIFALTFDSTGTLTNIAVEGKPAGGESWNDIAKEVATAIARKKVRVPPHANGLALRIAVESYLALPSGARVAVGGVNVDAINTPNTDPASGVERPNYGGLERKLPGVAGMGVGGNFDLSDIGAKKTRMVQARTIQATAL